jgi:hypothetical protein
MVIERSYQRVFYETALPSIFHATPEDFLFYLERDGNKFLKFYWEQVGKRHRISDRMDAYGLNYIIRKPKEKVTVALVLLPVPQVTDEAYFEAFVYRPRRLTPVLRISDITTVFAQTLASSAGDKVITKIIERTRKDQTIDHGLGPEPVVEEFYRAVLELIRDSRGNI